MAETLATIRGLLETHDQMSLASQGVRIWSEVLTFTVEGDQILCTVQPGSQSLANIRLNPRVSFSVGSPRAGQFLNGNGIARIDAGDSATVRITPYRFMLGSRDGDASANHIEKRRLEWRSAGPVPMAAGTAAGVVGKTKFWLQAARAVSFPLSILPLTLGTALALMASAFDPLSFFLVLLGGVSAHAGINLISDFNDFRKGVDTTDALSTHPGALVYELVRPESILAAAMLMFLVASQAGAFLLVRAGPAVIVFEGVGFLGGYFYTGGSLAYKYRGFGELFIALLMGPLMVLGAYVVQTGRIDAVPVLLSLALGSLVASVTLANNLRDVHDDRTAGISTLPMRIGLRSAKRLYYAMLTLPYAIVAGVVVLRLAHWPMLLVLLSLPSAAKAIRKILAAGDTAAEIRANAAKGTYPLNSIWLHLRFSLLLILGCGLVALFSVLPVPFLQGL